MKRDYTLLKEHTVGKEKMRPGDTVSLTDELARWLAEQGVIAMPESEMPEIRTPQTPAILMRSPPRPLLRKRCCGW